LILPANRVPHCWVVSWWPQGLTSVGDAWVALRSGGSKTVAPGVHGPIAAIMLAISAR